MSTLRVQEAWAIPRRPLVIVTWSRLSCVDIVYDSLPVPYHNGEMQSYLEVAGDEGKVRHVREHAVVVRHVLAGDAGPPRMIWSRRAINQYPYKRACFMSQSPGDVGPAVHGHRHRVHRHVLLRGEGGGGGGGGGARPGHKHPCC
jgi:hypothetical protein